MFLSKEFVSPYGAEEMPNIANWKTGSFIPLISQTSDLAVEGYSEDGNGRRTKCRQPVPRFNSLFRSARRHSRRSYFNVAELGNRTRRPGNLLLALGTESWLARGR
jgi:hypothetical protein